MELLALRYSKRISGTVGCYNRIFIEKRGLKIPFKRISMKIFLVLVFLFFECQITHAQQPLMQISGRVLDGASKTPLIGASIYMNHTTIGTISSDSGKFVLNDIPSGNYTLIISYVGYNSVSVSVSAQYHPPFRVEMYKRENALKEVVVTADAHWKEYFSLFKLFFLGSSDNAMKCSLENPEALSFDYNDTSYVLTAETNKTLVILNKALGYKVYFDIIRFIHYAGRTSYTGYSHFEEMNPEDSREQRKWNSNREKAYYGSLPHFMRALVTKQLAEEGFLVKKLVKSDKNTTDRPALLRWQGDEFKSSDTVVTMRWNGRDYSPEDTALTRFDLFSMKSPDDVIPQNSYEWGHKMGYNVLYPGNVPYDSIISPMDKPGNFKLDFNNSLFITYRKEKTNADIWGYGKAYSRRSFETSILTMLIPETFIDQYGNLANPNAVISEGYWATLRVANQLPFDYTPEK